MHHRSRSYKIFTVFNTIFLLLLGILCILPLVHILAVSFSASAPANANLVRFLPIDFTVAAWGQTLGNENFLRAFGTVCFEQFLVQWSA